MIASDGMVTLANGQLVHSNSQAWMQECKVRHDHVQTLLRMRGAHMRHARQQYLDNVSTCEGAESARRLKELLLQAWAVRDAAQPGGES